MPRIRKNNEYISHGVIINPPIAAAGEEVKISYDGSLSKNGAHEIVAQVSFGPKFENPTEYGMSKNTTGFEVTIPVADADTMNVCFKDVSNNQDNNSGKNYTFDVAQ